MYQNITTEQKGKILIVTVNRPDKLNALNKNTIAEIRVAINAASSDNSVGGIILTGAGTKAFVAGADISEFAAYSLEEGKALAAHGHAVFNSIEACGKPVIAAVNIS